MLVPVAIDTALFTLFALHHSLFARPFVKRRLFGVRPGRLGRPGSDRRSDPSSERLALHVWIASVLFIAVCAAWRPVPGELYHVTGVLRACRVRGSRRRHRPDGARLGAPRRSRPRRRARGLALRAPPTHVPLQTRGVYGFVRHPLYFAWVLMVFGTPHMTMTRLTFAVLSTAYLAIAIPFEERGLLDVFGPEYREYQKRVRWRMIPGVY